VALQIVVDLYGSTPAAAFGPLALQAVRERMIQQPKGGAKAKPDTKDDGDRWSRSYVNSSVARVKRMFKWAVSRELAPVAVHQALACVAGLRRGKSAARETKPVRPVPQADVDATLDHLPPVVADMVRLQQLTGCRPGELVILRPMDLDRSKPTWCYVPSSHKNAHRGDQRRIYFGPQAKAILATYLLRAADAFCFSPAESESKRHAEQRDARKSPVQPSQANRRKVKPKWTAMDQYDVHAYRRAIARACKAANVTPWHPHQLRHSTATNLREKYGIEASQVVLCHSDANITLVYAEKNFAMAERIMAEVG
jgi:integrase